MIQGFTGTREQTTPIQRHRYRQYVDADPPDEMHHGACVGADEEAVTICAGRAGRIVAHPPEVKALQSRYAIGMSDDALPDRDYLERNKCIVDLCDYLAAMPRLMTEEERSGTWSTIRYARKLAKPIVIFWPDGTVSKENFK